MNKTILITPFIVLTTICLFFLIYILLGKNPNDPPSALLNKNLPFFSSINLYDKEEILLSDSIKGRYTLIFLAPPNDEKTEIELTYNWDGDELGEGSRNFGHLAYRVDNIYESCQRLMDMGYTINRPPRDGHMAFVRSPDKISIELLQDGYLEPKEPWASMENTGSW